MEFLLSLFTFGTIWFFLLVAAAVIAIIACVENDSPGWATTVFISYVLLLQKLGHVPLFRWIAHHPFLLLGYFAGYLALGTGYSILKWTSYVYKTRDQQLRHKWPISVPQVDSHRSEIIGWMMYWPLSVHAHQRSNAQDI